MTHGKAPTSWAQKRDLLGLRNQAHATKGRERRPRHRDSARPQQEVGFSRTCCCSRTTFMRRGRVAAGAGGDGRQRGNAASPSVILRKCQGFRPEPASAHPAAPPAPKQAPPGRCSRCPTRRGGDGGGRLQTARSQAALCWAGAPTALWFLSAPDLDVQVSLLGSQHHLQAAEAVRVVTSNSDFPVFFIP